MDVHGKENTILRRFFPKSSKFKTIRTEIQVFFCFCFFVEVKRTVHMEMQKADLKNFLKRKNLA